MKKDLVLQVIKKALFIWKEAKKPVLETDFDLNFSLRPTKYSPDNGKKLSIRGDLELTLLYVLLFFLGARALCRLLGSIFD